MNEGPLPAVPAYVARRPRLKRLAVSSMGESMVAKLLLGTGVGTRPLASLSGDRVNLFALETSVRAELVEALLSASSWP